MALIAGSDPGRGERDDELCVLLDYHLLSFL